jgi:hypothetical protein
MALGWSEDRVSHQAETNSSLRTEQNSSLHFRFGLPNQNRSSQDGLTQLPGWTTLIPCEQDEDALVDYLRSSRPVFLTDLEQPIVALAA